MDGWGRTAGAGVVLGAAGALLLGVIELGYVCATAYGYFDGPIELGRFAGCTLGLLGALGVLAGLAEGVLAAIVAGAARAIHRQTAEHEWQARLYTALAVPPVALGCAQIFAGPRAQTIPGHDAWAAAIGLVALLVIYLSVRWYLRARPRAWPLAGAAAASAVGLYLADHWVLPRLYPFFHVGLVLLAFAACQLAAAVAFRRLGRGSLSARACLGIAALCVGAGALGLGGLERARGLRTLALERTGPLARALKLAQRVHPVAAPVVAARGPSTPAPAAPPAALPAGPRLPDADILLITVDAMRADRLSPRTAPFLSGLAAGGVVFDRAYAAVPHTSFSVASLLTGKHVYALSTLGLDAGRHETLAQVLRRERYKTGAFYPPSVFYIDHDRLRALEQSAYGFEYVKYEYLPAPERTDQVIRFFESEQPTRAFVWVHYIEPHEPYEPHAGHTAPGAATRERYDGEIHFVDAEVERLIGWVKTHRKRALVVLAADHGEEFGEHGGHYHGTTLHDEQIHVPLVFALVGGGELPARHVGGPVGLVDVAPTLLSLLGIPRSLRMRGRDLGPWLSAEGAPDAALGPVYAEIDKKKMIVDGHDKLICDLETEACQLYDLSADPGETRNRAGDTARLGALRARLDAWMAEETRFERAGAEAAIDPKIRRVLERARLGDRGAVRDVAALLGAADPPVRREAARLLAALPPEPSVRAQVEEGARDADPEVARWAQVACARLGDASARARVAGFVAEACAGQSGALCARAALALGDVGWLGRALERVGDDKGLQLELVRALGASKDPRASGPLLVQLAEVRTRLEVVDALGQLGDPGALPTLERWVAGEPYIPVRARLVAVIGTLAAAPAHRPPAIAALEALAGSEREPPVRRALSEQLRALGGNPSVIATLAD